MYSFTAHWTWIICVLVRCVENLVCTIITNFECKHYKYQTIVLWRTLPKKSVGSCCIVQCTTSSEFVQHGTSKTWTFSGWQFWQPKTTFISVVFVIPIFIQLLTSPSSRAFFHLKQIFWERPNIACNLIKKFSSFSFLVVFLPADWRDTRATNRLLRFHLVTQCDCISFDFWGFWCCIHRIVLRDIAAFVLWYFFPFRNNWKVCVGSIY